MPIPTFIDSVLPPQEQREEFMKLRYELVHGDPKDLAIQSFLMVGQSNMAGRASLEGLSERLDMRCFMLRNGRWQFMVEPVNIDRAVVPGFGPQSGVGLASTFARELAKRTQQNIGLIPCADGGTEISQWLPDGLLFKNAVSQARQAALSSHLAGILWHQGETDMDLHGGGGYEEMFFEVMHAFRRELGDLPIVVGEIGYPENGFFRTKPESAAWFNQKIHEWAAQLPLCGAAKADHACSQEDGCHFNTASTKVMGQHYCDVYLSLTGGNLPEQHKKARTLAGGNFI